MREADSLAGMADAAGAAGGPAVDCCRGGGGLALVRVADWLVQVIETVAAAVGAIAVASGSGGGGGDGCGGNASCDCDCDCVCVFIFVCISDSDSGRCCACCS